MATKSTARSVYRDLYPKDQAAEMEMRSLLLMALGRWLANGDMTQTEAAKVLGITQARVSDIKRGKISVSSPIARALIEARRNLSLHPEDRGDTMEILDGLMQKPDAFAGDFGAWANLSALYYLLVREKSLAAIDPAQLVLKMAVTPDKGPAVPHFVVELDPVGDVRRTIPIDFQHCVGREVP